MKSGVVGNTKRSRTLKQGAGICEGQSRLQAKPSISSAIIFERATVCAYMSTGLYTIQKNKKNKNKKKKKKKIKKNKIKVAKEVEQKEDQQKKIKLKKYIGIYMLVGIRKIEMTICQNTMDTTLKLKGILECHICVYFLQVLVACLYVF